MRSRSCAGVVAGLPRPIGTCDREVAARRSARRALRLRAGVRERNGAVPAPTRPNPECSRSDRTECSPRPWHSLLVCGLWWRCPPRGRELKKSESTKYSGQVDSRLAHRHSFCLRPVYVFGEVQTCSKGTKTAARWLGFQNPRDLSGSEPF